MLNTNFINKGFEFIEPHIYLNHENTSSLHDLKKIFDLELEVDRDCALRKRAYLKLLWNKHDSQLKLSEEQNYFQTKDSNHIDGGKIRQFKIMNKNILNLPIIQSLIHKNLMMIREYTPLNDYKDLTIGMHFIRYMAEQHCASFSSPDWLHKDDEPLVFVHLVNLSKAAWGGDNLIANDHKKITHVIRLENEMDTLVLNKSVYHAVTPIGSSKGISVRDVILFTIELDNLLMLRAEVNAA